MTDKAGPLIIIGGHEDKDGKRQILAEVARRLNGGKLVVATVASHQPEGYFDAYKAAFGALGVTDLVEFYVQERIETLAPDALACLDGASVSIRSWT